MEDFCYLRRLVEERSGEALLRAARRGPEVEFEPPGSAALKEIRRLSEERDAAVERLRAVYDSTSWRLMGPARRVARVLRAMRGALSAGKAEAPFVDDAGTAEILRRFLINSLAPQPLPLHMQLGSGALVRARISRASSGPAAEGGAEPRFTIVTPYFDHLGFFGRCADSVARLMRADLAASGAARIAWIVVNDDPSCPEALLRDLLSPSIRDRVRVLSDGRNRGISGALNLGVAAAEQGWILLLDCDDAIEPNAVRELESHIAADPACRYFSSAIIDIDQYDSVLRRRRHQAGPDALFESGMVMGHLIAFRRDLFDELGGFDERLCGVQDYHFAMRAALREPISQIAAHCYRYRWHPKSVSVSKAIRQANLTDAARADILRRVVGATQRPPICTAPLAAAPRGLCIIRTQGNRMELLTQAVASVRRQAIPFTPCVVVHGDAARRDFVARWLEATGAAVEGPAPIVLEASKPGRRRGYPCNVGLDQLAGGGYDLLCFLDDDDHLLPNFAPRLVEALRASDADFAFGQTNALPVRGEPFAQHQLMPAVALFHGNFIPINSYVARTEAVLATRARFDETLHYLEDWDFLVQLVAGGARGVPVFETIAEYRIIGDGNTAEKRDQAHYDYCLSEVRARGAASAARLPADLFWSGILDFPADRRSAFALHEIAHLVAARDLFPPVDPR